MLIRWKDHKVFKPEFLDELQKLAEPPDDALTDLNCDNKPANSCKDEHEVEVAESENMDVDYVDDSDIECEQEETGIHTEHTDCSAHSQADTDLPTVSVTTSALGDSQSSEITTVINSECIKVHNSSPLLEKQSLTQENNTNSPLAVETRLPAVIDDNLPPQMKNNLPVINDNSAAPTDQEITTTLLPDDSPNKASSDVDEKLSPVVDNTPPSEILNKSPPADDRKSPLIVDKTSPLAFDKRLKATGDNDSLCTDNANTIEKTESMKLDQEKHIGKSNIDTVEATSKHENNEDHDKNAVDKVVKPLLDVKLPCPRLCYIYKSADFQGYGFGLSARKDRQGQYIGHVSKNSPAEKAGLIKNDHVIEVNGTYVGKESHNKVVALIQGEASLVRLLVVSDACERHCDKFRIPIHANMKGIQVCGRRDVSSDLPTHNVVECVVVSCKEASSSVSYHAVPWQDLDLLEAWVERLHQAGTTWNMLNKDSVVCSRHFDPQSKLNIPTLF